MRYAAYIRVSKEEQLKGYSLDAQERIIREWVQARGGTVVKVYAEKGETATTTDRTAFQQLRMDARHAIYDAVIVHKFDRLARNRYDALTIKSLFRSDYKLKVFSASEASEDSDGAIGTLIEGIMECVADWYSRNLASEVRKGRKERVQQGMHNNLPPFGYIKKEKRLFPEPHEVVGLFQAFGAYATGSFSDHDIAQLLNEHGYQTKQNRPFSKDTVRLMLQNQTYLGKVRYQEYQRNPDRSRNRRVPTEWFTGKHEPIISQELFDKCHEVREERATHHQSTPKFNPYLLRGFIYCHRCCNSASQANPFPAFGKMRAQARSDDQLRYYRCRARDFNHICEQRAALCDTIDEQVVNALMKLVPPENWHERITEAMAEVLGERNLEKRLIEIRQMIERMDFRWDQGFITDKNDFLEKRIRLQKELEQLIPIANNELEQAADILRNFRHYWESCEGDGDGQRKLVRLIVERVYVQDSEVVALTLKANYHIVLGQKAKELTVFSG